jgi:hypothetical protein
VSIRPLLHAPDIDPVDTVAMSAIKWYHPNKTVVEVGDVVIYTVG